MDHTAEKLQGGLESTGGNRAILITGLIIAMLFGSLDQTIVGTAMPRIIGELGGLSMMTWVTTAYMLASTTVVPIAGKLADLMGRKSIYVTGLLIFVIGSAMCGLAQNMTQLIWFRGLQGIGAGVMMPMAMIIIGDLFTGKQRAKWQGIFGAMFGLSSVIGPQIGGWIVDASHWRWVFYINLPIGVLAIILISIGLGKSQLKKNIQFDWAGIFTMIVGVVSILLGLTMGGNQYEWASWQIIGLFGIGVITLTLFTWIESRAAEPILPVRLFKHKTFLTLNGIGFLMSVGMFGSIMFVPLYLQGILGVSASASGSAMTPMMLTIVLGSILGGRLVQKLGVRLQTATGMVIMAISFVLLSTLAIDTSRWMVTLYMVVLGMGMGLVMPILTVALQESFPKSELGVVTSSSQFSRQIGGTFGMAILGAVLNAKSSQLLTDKMEPIAARMPGNEMIQQLMVKVNENAQGLYSSLLDPKTLAKMPPMFNESVLPILKTSLVQSLHSVFLFGLVFVLLGTVLTVFLGNVRISDREEEKGEEPLPEVK
ncbi:drug resistance transporter, EmrB/QacA subfamily [Marininema mesophilum]|uniref:Drug resistance transporter, EmrB/QacA subfamily n=1 Tax=Marininema mesophilum TaxID=1048340 RepID=A0A1H3AVN7_9BACL|nr:MDR family MFS transporter [Marininema mesophilum]SDX32899.1 drug resistance transporter, EmrB/QacA subfamily [Marininema mesophilum]